MADVMPSGVHGPCTVSVSHARAGSWKTGAPYARLPLPPPGLGSHCDRVAFDPAVARHWVPRNRLGNFAESAISKVGRQGETESQGQETHSVAFEKVVPVT